MKRNLKIAVIGVFVILILLIASFLLGRYGQKEVEILNENISHASISR